MTDTVSDALTRIKNANIRGKDTVSLPKAKLVKDLLEVMLREEFIVSYEELDGMYDVSIKYEDNGEPLLTEFKRISKPGQRVYVKYSEILPVMNGRGISVISTSQGVMSGSVAKAKKLGGEYICNIW